MVYSTSTKLAGSHKNSYMAQNTPPKYCYGKGTTYGFNEISRDNLEHAVEDFLFYAVSPYVYKTGHRHRNNQMGIGNVLVLDIDSDTDIRTELFSVLNTFDFQYMILPTQNHLTPTNGGGVYFKYRLVVPVENIQTEDQYKDMLRWLVHTYKIPAVDTATYTDARLFAPALPIPGQKFAKHSPDYPQQYTVTEEDYKYHLIRLQLIDDKGELVLNPKIYPYNTTARLLPYVAESELHTIVNTEVEAVNTIIGRELTELYEDSSNLIDPDIFRRLSSTPKVAFGDVAYEMRANDRVFCKCPTHHLHSDPNDHRYSWLLKTGAGEVRLYCSSDHCTKDYGDFRAITLPQWQDFVSDANYEMTASRTEALMENVVNNLAIMLTDPICHVYGMQVEQWYERKALAIEKLFNDLLDKNALMILLLCTVKEGALTTIYDITLSGGVVGQLNAKSSQLLMQGGWYSYLFKAEWSKFVKALGNPDITKLSVVKSVIDTVTTDLNYTTGLKKKDLLKPSQMWKSNIQIGLELGGKIIEVTNNSFDSPVYRNYNRLVKEGVLQNKIYYDSVIKAFYEHWKLPYGAVTFEHIEFNDLLSVLLLFSCFNVFTDGVANQRHSAFVITAPSGIGKSSFIKNLTAVGLTNDESFGADVYGYNGLYPKSIEPMKNKLFTTGDELSPKTMKNISMPVFLSNLTRLHVNVNVKGQIDNEFSAFAKVLWGARAWEAISLGDQATELRKRLYAITYRDFMFRDTNDEQTAFLKMCEDDYGTIDNIIQHQMAERYIALKTYVLSLDPNIRVQKFNEFRRALKDKYSGTLSYTLNEDETEIVVTEVASDSERLGYYCMYYVLKHRTLLADGKFDSLMFDPMRPDAVKPLIPDRILQFCEGVEHSLSSAPYNLNVVVVPNNVAGLKQYFKGLNKTVKMNREIVNGILAGEVDFVKLVQTINNIAMNLNELSTRTNIPDIAKKFSNRDARKKFKALRMDVRGYTFTVIDVDTFSDYVQKKMETL